MGGILWGIVVLLFVFWVVGLVFHIAGNLIHLVLVIALIVAIWNLVTSQRARRL